MLFGVFVGVKKMLKKLITAILIVLAALCGYGIGTYFRLYGYGG
jgi:hypothetical protein